MVHSKYAKKFSPTAEIECVKCSKWLTRKSLPTHLRTNHKELFAGPDSENCLDLSEFNIDDFARERRFNREFTLKKVAKLQEMWTEAESNGKRGAAVLGMFFLEDEHGNLF